MITFIVAVIFIYVFYKWATSNNDFFEKRGIAYLKPAFLIGNNANMIMQKLSLSESVIENHLKMKREKIYGFFNFRKPVYVVNDPKLLKYLFIKHFDHFTDRREIIPGDIDPMFGKSVLNLKGAKWREMRSTLSPAFTSSKMRQMFDLVNKVGEQAAGFVKQRVNSGAENEYEFQNLATKFTVDSIATCAFGLEVNSFDNPNNSFFKLATNSFDFKKPSTVLKFMGYLAVPSLMKAFKIKLFDKEVDNFFNEAFYDTMKTREEKGIVRNDMINIMMNIKKGQLKHESLAEEKTFDSFASVEESEIGKSVVTTKWDDEELAAQCFVFFGAGFDTVSTISSFFAYELAVNPDIQKRLQAEIDQVNSESSEGKPSYEQIMKMTYMDQVLSEVLRKWSVAPIMDRVCVKDFHVDFEGKSFTIEKGAELVLPLVAFHHDPEYFPEPAQFDPERFNEENKKNIDLDTYLPFGIGPRNCIGSRFALMELKTIFYHFLLNLNIEVTKKTQIPLKYMKSPVSFKAENGVWIALTSRN